MRLLTRCALAVAALAGALAGCSSVSSSTEVLSAEAGADTLDAAQAEHPFGGSSGAGGTHGSADAESEDAGSEAAPIDAPQDISVEQDAVTDKLDPLDSASEYEADAFDVEGSADAPEPPAGVVKIVEVSLPNATGMAQQTHLIYATVSQHWWLFFEDADAPSAIHTRWSPDFAVWNLGPDLSMPAPHGNDGRNLSVAFAVLNGHEVVHLTYGAMPGGASRSRYHAKGEIAGTSITLDTPVLVNSMVMSDSDPVDPDGCVTAISKIGEVMDLSSWINLPDGSTPGGVYAWHSTSADDGASFSESWGPMEAAIDASFGRSHAKALVALDDGTWLAATHVNPPDCSTTDAIRSGGQWGASAGGGFCGGDVGDPNDFHYQRTISGAVIGYSHTIMNYQSGYVLHFFDQQLWAACDAGFAQPNLLFLDPLATGTGMFLASDGFTFDLYGMRTDSAIRTTHWDLLNCPFDWSPSATVVPSTGIERSYLSGYSDYTRAALIWTEPAAGGFAIMGYRLTP